MSASTATRRPRSRAKPLPDWLGAYPGAQGDLFRSAPAPVAEVWRRVTQTMAQLSGGDPRAYQEQLARQIQDLGLTFRVAGDTEERDWPLTAMPLIVGAEEWASVERGLVQRARLLEAVAADIYGPQSLVHEGHLPAAVVAGSPYFARSMVGLRPLADHYLHVYAVDLARGPDGQWRVLSDRMRLANGIGYALENRLAIARSTGTVLGDVHTRRLAGFFADLRDGIAADCQRDSPRIGLLTPGRLNQSHAEQAYLARYLGFPLVEGRDLMVQDDRLFLRTVSGPKRIDAVWRWLDTNALDPLAFDARSMLGVPDLYRAWAHGGLEMANWPGVEVLESRALSAFLPRLFGTLLGEEPLLPNTATWWCGQSMEAGEVHRRFDELVISAAFSGGAEGLPGGASVAGGQLDAEQREALLAAMRRRPMDYCGQEIIHLSTTPALIDGALAPRAFTLRAFVARAADGSWSVMPGGFARLSSGALQTSLMGDGDLSADVWVVDAAAQPRQIPPALSDTPPIRRGGGLLASQAADNLFWFGRYAERAENTLRLLQALLSTTVEVNSGEADSASVGARLVRLLRDWGAIAPEDLGKPIVELCARALGDSELPGAMGTLIRRIQGTGLALRQRFSRDFWRIANQPPPQIKDRRPQALLQTIKDLNLRFSALSGQISENMMRGPAWVFLDIGRRLERASTICRITRQLGAPDGDSLNMLLDLSDAQVTYRQRYLTGARAGPVLDLVLLDPDNPRSLSFQIDRLVAHIARLPRLSEDNVPERTEREARAILAPLQTLAVDEIGDRVLGEIEARLVGLSDTLAARYFLPTERPASLAGTLLA